MQKRGRVDAWAPVAGALFLGVTALWLVVLWQGTVSARGPVAWQWLPYGAFSVATLAVVALCWQLLVVVLGRRGEVAVWVVGLVLLLQALFGLLYVGDLRAYQVTGLHLYDAAVLQALANPGVGREWRLPASLWVTLAGLGLGFWLLQWGCWWLLRWWVGSGAPRRSRWLFWGALGLMWLQVLFGVVSTWVWCAREGRVSPALAGLPLYVAILGPSRHRLPLQALDYPQGAIEEEVFPGDGPPILFVLVESWRGDALTPSAMPGLSAWMARHGCVRSERHFAGGHTTEFGVFTLLYGLHGFLYHPAQAAALVPWPFERLRAAGYRIEGEGASSLCDWNGGGFICDAFDTYREELAVSPEVGDGRLVARALAAMDEPGPWFRFVFLASTHHNYHYPASYEVHRPVLPADYNHFLGDAELAGDAELIRNRYRNALAYVDDLLVSLLEGMASKPAWWVVVTGDHGEEFWEHGLLGHGAPHFTRERLEVPLLLCGSGLTGHRRVRLSSHVDVWPTLLWELAPALAARASDWSHGAVLQKQNQRSAVVVGGLSFPWGYDRVALFDEGLAIEARLCSSDVMALCVESVRDDAGHEELGRGGEVAEALRRFGEEFARFLRAPARGWRGSWRFKAGKP